MNQRERILAVLRGKEADRVPFTVYSSHLPRGEMERYLRDEGVGIIEWCAPFTVEYPHVVRETKEYWESGHRFIRETIHTPIGSLYQIFRTGGGYDTNLRCNFYIKQPEDYEIIEFMYGDAVYKPNYDNLSIVLDRVGQDGTVHAWLGYTPIQEMIYTITGIERFSIDYHENRDLIDNLFKTIAECHKEVYKIAANSPAQIILYGDNISSEMIGLERFKRYHMKCYRACHQALAGTGKLLAVHMDGNLNTLKEAIAESPIDVIEAFTPPPDCDLSLSEARKLWKNKAIWINYPSSIHLAEPEKIYEHTMRILGEVVPGDRFAISITENIPTNVWKKSLSTILRVIKEKGSLPLV